jgi:hypothetical protein
MSFVSASIVGSSILDGVSAAQNPPYNTVKLNGHCTVDKLRVLDYAMTIEELDGLTIADVYTWDAHTRLYAEFTNNLQAGSISIAEPVESWDVIRFRTDSITPEVIATGLPGSATGIIDYTATLPYTYYYLIYPITATAVVAFVQSNTVKMCYDYYSFLDPTSGISFTFKLNIEAGNRSLVAPTSVYEGFTEYPAVSQGNLNYHTFQFSALLGNVKSNAYVGDTVEMYEALRAFIRNGNFKYMKDLKGNIRKVFTHNLNSNIDEKISELPTYVSFECIETGEV